MGLKRMKVRTLVSLLRSRTTMLTGAYHRVRRLGTHSGSVAELVTGRLASPARRWHGAANAGTHGGHVRLSEDAPAGRRGSCLEFCP